VIVAGVLAYAVTRNPPFRAIAEEPASNSRARSGAALPSRVDLADPKWASSPAHAIRLAPSEMQALGIETTAAYASDKPDQVRMSATTALNPDSLAHVHPRFAGEATEVKVRLGQRVRKGQPLVAVWSKDLGEKKSEYMDARSQLKLNQEVLDKLTTLQQQGAIPERSYRQGLRDLEASRIARNRAYRTLVSWRLSKEEIDRIEHESDADWARETIKAPVDGVIIEKNLVPGELVDPTMNLFVIADLSRIAIWAYAFEEDLLKVKPGQAWSVTLKALPNKTLEGTVSVVGALVDPTQHTVTIQGTIPNPGETLRAGMYATAVIALPPNPGHVVVPTVALIDRDNRTMVYVQSEKHPDQFVARVVHVQERLQNEAYLSSGVSAGEKVVSRGGLELDQKAGTRGQVLAREGN
jgi:cobalt-zinc-cadmium efflux system membrane fusion protein